MVAVGFPFKMVADVDSQEFEGVGDCDDFVIDEDGWLVLIVPPEIEYGLQVIVLAPTYFSLNLLTVRSFIAF